MRKKLTLSLMILIMFGTIAFAQDVIIKKDGLIIHANIEEVGFEVVKYRKATYPDGPVFSIYRDEIYAIAYGDNTSDYFSLGGLEGVTDARQEEKSRAYRSSTRERPHKNDTTASGQSKTLLSAYGLPARIGTSVGLGIINTYSQAEEGLDDLDQKSSFPAVYLRIWTDLDETIRLGVQVSLATFNYEGDEINEYDEIISLFDVKEKVLSISGFVRYEFQGNLLYPYALIGLGFTRSNIETRRNLAFAEEGPVFRINSSAQTVNFSVLLRGGVSLALAENISAYADIGTGISLLQAGAQFVIMLN